MLFTHTTRTLASALQKKTKKKLTSGYVAGADALYIEEAPIIPKGLGRWVARWLRLGESAGAWTRTLRVSQ